MTDSTEEPANGVGKPIALPVFFLVSVFVATVAGLLAWALLWALGKDQGAEQLLLFATLAGFVVSTGGWAIVIYGFNDDPAKIIGYFGAGVLTKMVLLVLTVALVKGFEFASLKDFFLPFVVVFFLTGFVQLYITVKGASKLFDEAKMRSRLSEAVAPGVAVMDDERERHVDHEE